MGQRTDAAIATWQAKAGIKPAAGERARVLDDLSKACFEAIKIIELERSGIRDGDGYWHGSDVIGHMARELIELCSALTPRPSDEEMQWWYREQALWEDVNGCGKPENDHEH
jgi:hypothetical protein